MKTVSKLKCCCGCEYDKSKRDAAERHDIHSKLILALEKELNPAPDTCEVSVQQDRKKVLAVTKALFEANQINNGVPFTPIGGTVADGILDDSLPNGCKLRHVAYRLACIDSHCIEWGQPYFAIQERRNEQATRTHIPA